MIQERVRAGLRRAVSEGKQNAHQEGPGGSWEARRAGDRQAVWRGCEYRAADQPPFRSKRPPRRGREDR
jgi:hypothetical protein